MLDNFKTHLYYILESPGIVAHKIYTSSKGFLTSSKAFLTSSKAFFSFTSKEAVYNEFQTIGYHRAMLKVPHPFYHEENTSSLYIKGMLGLYMEILQNLLDNREQLLKQKFVYNKEIHLELAQAYTNKIDLYTDNYVIRLKEKLEECQEAEVVLRNDQSSQTDVLPDRVIHDNLLVAKARNAKLETKYATLETAFKKAKDDNNSLVARHLDQTKTMRKLETTIIKQEAELEEMEKKCKELFTHNTRLEKEYNELFANHLNVLDLVKKNINAQKLESQKEALKVNETDLKVDNGKSKNTMEDAVKDIQPSVIIVKTRNLTTQVADSTSIPIMAKSDDSSIVD